MPLAVGENVGPYRITEQLGQGGMATVYHAYDPMFEREVALKILKRESLNDLQTRERFERETKIIARLEHAAIVPVYDVGRDRDQLFFVMRYMSGGSLILAGGLALGLTVSGYYANRDEMADKLRSAAKSAGEAMWQRTHREAHEPVQHDEGDIAEPRGCRVDIAHGGQKDRTPIQHRAFGQDAMTSTSISKAIPAGRSKPRRFARA